MRPTPGPTALIPAMRGYFAGWERADSIVVNPHKWMFTPFDCSLLLTRRMSTLRDALSLVPEYLRTTDGKDAGRDYNEYIPQLGRRARGIKMWMQLRYFGLSGLRARLQEHLDLARRAGGLDRRRPRLRAPGAGALRPGLLPLAAGAARRAGKGRPAVAAELDAVNERLMNRLNETGRRLPLAHPGRTVASRLRIAIGNIRTERRHVEAAWRLVRELAADLDGAVA